MNIEQNKNKIKAPAKIGAFSWRNRCFGGGRLPLGDLAGGTGDHAAFGTMPAPRQHRADIGQLGRNCGKA
ncbi:hypothetical protein Q4577_12865 [Marinovum sp. 2_MG-2023]|nr:hypothetical protein [Marinovum sp. 2_MG-2023]MDO6780143.1 hypothetical protein [Marinovum sp. 1_MG-2023]